LRIARLKHFRRRRFHTYIRCILWRKVKITQIPHIGYAEALAEAGKDECFVLGRNIYQAACGSANSAVNFLTHLNANLARLPENVAFHVLNGVLFEIYFDSTGLKRKKAKAGRIDEVVDARVETTTRTNAAGHQPRCASLFSQMLNLIDRGEFAAVVQRTGAEDRTKGFSSSWDQFVAMSFCQLAQAKSLREIEEGLACCEGRLRHLGVDNAPARSTLS
jgi:hypothetical protein